MLPENVRRVIDTKAGQVLVATPLRLNPITQRAAEQQASTGIQGSAGHGIYVRGYFDFFRSAVGELLSTTLRLLEVSDPVNEPDILDYLDKKIDPFRNGVDQYVLRVSHAAFSPQEPNLTAVYKNLRGNFSVELAIVQAKRRAAQIPPPAVTINNGSNFQIGNHNVQKS
jgi:hypothetical protein